jgi:hypothetical protein
MVWNGTEWVSEPPPSKPVPVRPVATVVVALGLVAMLAIIVSGPPSGAAGSDGPAAGVTATLPGGSRTTALVAATAASATPRAPATATPKPTPRSAATSTPKPTPRPTAPSASKPVAPPAKVLFGIGPEADGAAALPFVRDAHVHMLTSWYNGPGDLAWMTGWRGTFVPKAYQAGYVLHLIVYSGEPHTTISTKYGDACGQAYPLSSRFVDDMERLAGTFAGHGRLYVTLFTEFQTYACTNNAWNPNPETNAYWRALKDQYMAALHVFHKDAPNARVSLGWGGWQTRWDEPAIGGGRSMFSHFADVMRASDFESFQAMQTDTNVSDVLNMTRTLGGYGPVMLAHYKPDNGSQSVFNADTRTMLTDSYLRKLVAARLFAWSFMDEKNIDSSTTTYDRVVTAVRLHAR